MENIKNYKDFYKFNECKKVTNLVNSYFDEEITLEQFDESLMGNIMLTESMLTEGVLDGIKDKIMSILRRVADNLYSMAEKASNVLKSAYKMLIKFASNTKIFKPLLMCIIFLMISAGSVSAQSDKYDTTDYSSKGGEITHDIGTETESGIDITEKQKKAGDLFYLAAGCLKDNENTIRANVGNQVYEKCLEGLYALQTDAVNGTADPEFLKMLGESAKNTTLSIIRGMDDLDDVLKTNLDTKEQQEKLKLLRSYYESGVKLIANYVKK